MKLVFVDNVNLMNVVHNRSAEKAYERDHGRTTDIQQGALDNVRWRRVGAAPFFVVSDIIGTPWAIFVQNIHTRSRKGSRSRTNQVPQPHAYHLFINNQPRKRRLINRKSDSLFINQRPT